MERRSKSLNSVIPSIKYGEANGFLLVAGPCVIEGREMALEIAEHICGLSEKYQIPFVFKASYRKANRSRLDSFTGIGDEKALRILQEVGLEFSLPVIRTFPSSRGIKTMLSEAPTLRNSLIFLGTVTCPFEEIVLVNMFSSLFILYLKVKIIEGSLFVK